MAGGQSSTTAAGSLSQAIAVAQVGSAVAVAQGAITANNSGTVALSGQAAASAQQAIGPTFARPATGSAATATSGSLTVNLRPTDIASPAVTVSPGVVTAQGSGLTTHLSGMEVTSGQGDVTGGTSAISGEVVASASGAHVLVLTLPLAGLALASDIGVVGSAQEADDTLVTSAGGTTSFVLAVLVVGAESVGEQGSVTVTSDAFIPLTGAESTCAAGSLEANEQYELGGQAVTAEQQSVGAPGTAALSGAAADVFAGSVFLTGDREFPLTGAETTSEAGSTFADFRFFAEGLEIVGTAENIGPREVALGGTEAVAEAGFVEIPPVFGGATAAQILQHANNIQTPPPYNDDDLIAPLKVPDWHPDDEKVYTALAHLVIRGYFSGKRI